MQDIKNRKQTSFEKKIDIFFVSPNNFLNCKIASSNYDGSLRIIILLIIFSHLTFIVEMK